MLRIEWDISSYFEVRVFYYLVILCKTRNVTQLWVHFAPQPDDLGIKFQRGFEIWNLSCHYTYQPVYWFSWWSVHARARKRQKRSQLLISLRLHVVGSYVRVRARIIMKINILVDRYTESLSLKFHECPFIGCWEIAKTKLSMYTHHF